MRTDATTKPNHDRSAQERIVIALERIADALDPSADVLPVREYVVEVWESEVDPGGYHDRITVKADNPADATNEAIALFKQAHPEAYPPFRFKVLLDGEVVGPPVRELS